MFVHTTTCGICGIRGIRESFPLRVDLPVALHAARAALTPRQYGVAVIPAQPRSCAPVDVGCAVVDARLTLALPLTRREPARTIALLREPLCSVSGASAAAFTIHERCRVATAGPAPALSLAPPLQLFNVSLLVSGTGGALETPIGGWRLTDDTDHPRFSVIPYGQLSLSVGTAHATSTPVHCSDSGRGPRVINGQTALFPRESAERRRPRLHVTPA